MEAKEYGLFSKRIFKKDCKDKNSQYSNINLNQMSHKCSNALPVQSYSKTNNNEQFGNTVNESYQAKLWSKSTKGLSLKNPKSVNVYDDGDEEGKDGIQQRWKKNKKCSNITSSTLSLHIAAYENSIESLTENKGLSTKLPAVDPYSSKIKDAFEFPRQMNDNNFSTPQIMQFKASQKLLSPNQGGPEVPKILTMADPNNDAEESRKRHLLPDDDADMSNEAKKVKIEEAKATRKAKRVHFNEQVESKIIGRAPKTSRRGKTTEDELYKANAKNVDVDEEGREVIGKINNHTLDSDEEDEKDHDVLDVRQLGGQEDRTVDFEGDTKITPFNMDEDLEEGHFDKSGNFIFDKKTEDLKDPWFDSVDWNKVQTTEENDNEAEEAEEEELEQDTIANRLPIYQTIVEYLKDGETANDAMKRLNKSRVPIQEERKLRFAAKKAGKPYVDPVAEQIEKITASADILIKKGDTTVYEMTKEHIQKVIDEAQKPTEEAMEEDDETEIMWEYKLAHEDDSALKKASTKEMMELTETEKLPGDALVRRCGTENFYSAGRVDFEIYLD